MTDLSFHAIGMETMRQYWPVFAAGAAVEVWLMRRRMRRSRPFPVTWVATAAIVAAGLAVAVWVESFLATQLAYQTVGEGARARPWEELQQHFGRSRPLLAGFAVAVLGLLRRPRSIVVMAGLVVAAGVLASWMTAMWLYVASHSPLLFRILVLPGGLGVVASLAGFTAATAIWMAIGRWIWGQRGRRRGITPHANANLPQLPG